MKFWAQIGMLWVCFVFSSHAGTILNGAGATFPFPLYQKWIQLFQNESDVRITYQGIGSGGGIEKLKNRSVDFAGVDTFINDEDSLQRGGQVLHIPTCIGAVSIIYHLPGQTKIKLTPDLISQLFLGRITLWNDAEIQKINPDIILPAEEITIVHRSEGSGTTSIFTDYLCKVSPEWQEQIGRGKKVIWPQGMGVEGNPGVAEMVKLIPGSMGYVEMTYAVNHGLEMALIQNKHGHFIKPSLESVTRAADLKIPADTRVLLTNTDARQGYPISSLTYLVFFKEQAYMQRSRDKALSLFQFLNWVLHQGQLYNRSMHYAPLPQTAVEKADHLIHQITYQGELLMSDPVLEHAFEEKSGN